MKFIDLFHFSQDYGSFGLRENYSYLVKFKIDSRLNLIYVLVIVMKYINMILLFQQGFYMFETISFYIIFDDTVRQGYIKQSAKNFTPCKSLIKLSFIIINLHSYVSEDRFSFQSSFCLIMISFAPFIISKYIYSMHN